MLSEPVLEIHLVVFQVAFLVRLLDAAAAGRVVMGDGQPDHAAVGEVERPLYKPFPESPSTDDRPPVIVLDGSGDNLCGRCRQFVDQHIDLDILQAAVAHCPEVLPARPASLGIDDHVIVPQELIGDLHGRLEIAAAVVLEVEEQRLHAFFLQ